MSVRRLSNSFISTEGRGKSSTLLAGYSPAIDEMELIQRVTVGSGGASSITFSNIPSTYQHLQIRGLLKDTAATVIRTMEMQIGNGSVDTSNNYAWHYFGGNGSSTVEGAGSSESAIRTTNLIMDNTANIFSPFVIDILDYASTSKATTVRLFGGFENNSAGRVSISSGLWTYTSAVDQIKIGSRSGFAGTLSQYSTLALYGVKA